LQRLGKHSARKWAGRMLIVFAFACMTAATLNYHAHDAETLRKFLQTFCKLLRVFCSILFYSILHARTAQVQGSRCITWNVA